MTALVAAALTGVCVLLVLAPPLRIVSVGRVSSWRVLAFGVLAVTPAVTLADLPQRRIVLAGIVVASLADLARRFRRRRLRAAAVRRSGRLLETCEALAADLRAGLPPVRALEAAAGGWDEFGPVAGAGQLGSDVPDALRALARRPGAGQARVVAAAWQVAHRSGAALAPALELAARTLREERSTSEVVETELAAARSTAALLAVLPVGVLALGAGAGGDPVGFLLDSGAGLLCLAAGMLLAHLGLAWLDLIADGVTR